MYTATPLPPVLAEIANISDHLVTDELAHVLRRASQTLRKAYSTTGHYLGIRPKKIGNRLLWPIEDVAKVLQGDAK